MSAYPVEEFVRGSGFDGDLVFFIFDSPEFVDFADEPFNGIPNTSLVIVQ